MIHVLKTFSFINGIKSDHKQCMYILLSLKRSYTAKGGVLKENVNKVKNRSLYLIKISH